MARFLSDEWISAFNASLDGVDLAELVTGGSVRAQSGSFSVEEQVSEVPDRPESAGPLRVVLTVEEGTVALARGDGAGGRPDVVVSLAYRDAAALSRGELEAADALATGRVHIRGDLHVLIDGQAILAAAASRMSELQADTTY